MLDRIKEFLGQLSGYKQKYEDLLTAKTSTDLLLEQAERLVDEILHTLRNWHVIK